MFRGSRSSTAVTPSTSVQPEKTEVSRISGTGAEVSEEHSTRASQLIERAHKRMSLSGQTPPLVRRLELIRFSYMSIGSIDCVGQSFRAQIFFELRFPGGAKDPALAAPGSDMAVIDGQLRPPAGWYKGQLDLKNFIEHNEPLDSNVIKSGDDLVLSMRFEGEFFENMELESFPFDMQELSIDIAINCRPNGKLPVDLVVAQDAQIGVSEHGFALHQLYDLDARMTYVERVTGDETSSCYPTITISARVYRRPGFVIYNVIIPMAAFVIMAGMQVGGRRRPEPTDTVRHRPHRKDRPNRKVPLCPAWLRPRLRVPCALLSHGPPCRLPRSSPSHATTRTRASQ